MKKRNPWVSISDLMSSVLLVLLLMFVMASIIPKYTQEAQRHEMLDQIDKALEAYKETDQVRIHLDTGILELTSVTFPSGSAEINPATQAIVRDMSGTLKEYMDKNGKMTLLIEGHTDPAAISQVINKGGYFENNIQLSTLRAANVRNALLGYMGNAYAGRIGVAGYGETRLKDTANPLAAENRRIEVRIVWEGDQEF